MDDYSSGSREWNYRPVLILVVVMAVCFYGWATLSKIEQHVRGSGRIVPAGQSKIVQNLEGGIVETINVQEGQSVRKNDVLMQIRNQRAKSDLEEQKIILAGRQVKLARLRAEHAGAEDFNYDANGASAIMEVVGSETQIFLGRKRVLNEKLGALNDQIRQKNLKLEDLNAQLSNMAAERKIAQDQLNINDRLRKSGAVSESRYLEAKSRVTNFDTRMEQIRKSIPITRAEIDELKSKIEGERQAFLTDTADEINTTELEIRQLQERMKAQSDQVERTALVSPVNGIVNKVHVTTAGGVIKPGEPLVEITPLDEDLIVEAKIPAKDRGKIWVGLPVMVKVTAYDYALYGGIEGRLSEISADSFNDEQGNTFYRARISLMSRTLGDEPLYPGMVVNADIISGQISIRDAILKPFWRIRETALRES